MTQVAIVTSVDEMFEVIAQGDGKLYVCVTDGEDTIEQIWTPSKAKQIIKVIEKELEKEST